MKRKVVSALLVSTMAVTAFVGCGGAAEETATETTQTEATEDEAASDTASTEDAIANLIAATEGTVNIDLWC